MQTAILCFSDQVSDTREDWDRGEDLLALLFSFYHEFTECEAKEMPNQLQNDRFRTYDQQIDILKNQKGLIISDETITKESLINIGYFSLIGGYKYPFKNPMTRKYINTTFEDIYALYKFDRELRELTFKYLCEVEMKIRQVISYCFCQHHGDSQTHYISTASYRSEPKYARDIAVLTNILSKIAIRDTDHSYLVHQRNAHQNVPLWVAVNALTFGQISKMYSLLPFSLQSAVAQEYPHVNEKELEQFLRCLTFYRNVCAHNECLYCFSSRRDIPDTNLHRKLNIPKTGTQYTQGKRDYFALVIAFRYLLSDDSFKKFKKSLVSLIRTYQKESSRLTQQQLYDKLGFPSNWMKLTQYKR